MPGDFGEGNSDALPENSNSGQEVTPEQVLAPTFSPGGGSTLTAPASIVLSSATSGASIKRRVNGGSYITSSVVNLSAAGTFIIEAYATHAGMSDSGVSSATYIVQSGSGGGGGGIVYLILTTPLLITNLSQINLTEGDTAPYPMFQIPDGQGRPLSLPDGTQVQFFLKSRVSAYSTDEPILVTGDCVIDSHILGNVYIPWAEPIPPAGNYNLQLRITFPDGKVMSAPSSGYAAIQVKPSEATV